MKLMFCSAVAASMVLSSACAADVKIGFISTLSGPLAASGQDTLDGFNLGVKSLGGQMGGRSVEVVKGDDQMKPDVARQLADKMVERDHIEILTGIVLSNVMLAVAKPVLDAGVFILSSNAGPSQLAGPQCNPLYFAVSFQNDTPNEAMGIYMQKNGYENVYLMAPNYPAGRDMLTGFKRYYKGSIAGEVYTQFGQLDYAADLAQLRAAKPSALYYFIAGGVGINFAKQYAQAGLSKNIPMFAPGFSLDQSMLPGIGDAAIGAKTSIFWGPDFKNAANTKFVADFMQEYKRVPSPYAAQAYDTARLLGAAIAETKGDTSDKGGLRKALENVKFDSVRGDFRFGRNHYPIQNFYLGEITRGADGVPEVATRELIIKDHADAYASQCKMIP